MKPASRTQAIFLPPERSISLWTIGMSTFARLSVSSRPSSSSSARSSPAGPLISAVDCVRGLARQRLAVDGDDHVAHLQPALLGRRAVVDLLDAQALLDLAHGHPDALELRPRCRAGSSCSPSARSSARTGPAATRPRRRATCSAAPCDRPCGSSRARSCRPPPRRGARRCRRRASSRANPGSVSGWPPSQMPSTRASGIRTARKAAGTAAATHDAAGHGTARTSVCR